jgi:hypothetical protein
MKKIQLISFIAFMLFLGFLAADWTPPDDINLRNLYEIINATNITAAYYCDSTSCYALSDLVGGGGSTYYAGGIYIYNNGSNYFFLNDTKLNQTSNSRIAAEVDVTFLQAILDAVYHPLWDYDFGDLINVPTYALNNTAGWTLNFTKIFSNDWSNVTITESQISDLQSYLTASPFGASIDDSELTGEDFGEFTCTGGEDGCTLDTGSFDDEYIELGDTFGGEVSGTYGAIVLGHDALDDQYYDSEADLTALLDDNYEGEGAHFDVSTTTNITCFNSACDWYTNATDSCMYWPSGGRDCGA